MLSAGLQVLMSWQQLNDYVIRGNAAKPIANNIKISQTDSKDHEKNTFTSPGCDLFQ